MKQAMLNKSGLIAAVTLLAAGCSLTSVPVAEPIPPAEPPPAMQSVTLYVPGMNEQLKIL